MIHVAYVRQKESLGLGHAVLMARELVGDEPFAVILADDVIDATKPCLKQMIEVFEETHSSIIATQEVKGPAISSYGVIDGKMVRGGRFSGRLFDVKNLVEKPKMEEAPTNQAIIGRYILTPEIFRALDRTPLGAGGELQLTDGMKVLLKKEKIYGYAFDGIRHDAGDKFGFLKATVEFALKRKDVGAQMREYLKSVKL
jgi:UTP--glucose-1-phosphate uridylyltransferase